MRSVLAVAALCALTVTAAPALRHNQETLSPEDSRFSEVAVTPPTPCTGHFGGLTGLTIKKAPSSGKTGSWKTRILTLCDDGYLYYSKTDYSPTGGMFVTAFGTAPVYAMGLGGSKAPSGEVNTANRLVTLTGFKASLTAKDGKDIAAEAKKKTLTILFAHANDRTSFLRRVDKLSAAWPTGGEQLKLEIITFNQEFRGNAAIGVPAKTSLKVDPNYDVSFYCEQEAVYSDQGLAQLIHTAHHTGTHDLIADYSKQLGDGKTGTKSLPTTTRQGALVKKGIKATKLFEYQLDIGKVGSLWRNGKGFTMGVWQFSKKFGNDYHNVIVGAACTHFGTSGSERSSPQTKFNSLLTDDGYKGIDVFMMSGDFNYRLAPEPKTAAKITNEQLFTLMTTPLSVTQLKAGNTVSTVKDSMSTIELVTNGGCTLSPADYFTYKYDYTTTAIRQSCTNWNTAGRPASNDGRDCVFGAHDTKTKNTEFKFKHGGYAVGFLDRTAMKLGSRAGTRQIKATFSPSTTIMDVVSADHRPVRNQLTVEHS